MSFSKRVIAALSFAVLFVVSSASAQITYVSKLAVIARAFKALYNQGPDIMFGYLPNSNFNWVEGAQSFNSQNMVEGYIHNGNSAVKFYSNSSFPTHTSLLSSLGSLQGGLALAVSNNGLDGALTGVYTQAASARNEVFITHDSGASWHSVTLPAVTATINSPTCQNQLQVYDDFNVQASGMQGVDDKNFQRSIVFDNSSPQPLLHFFAYQTVTTSNCPGLEASFAVVEHVIDPGNATPILYSRVLATTSASSYLNAEVSDQNVVLVAAIGDPWNSGSGFIPGGYHPEYFIIQNSTGNVHKGWIGEVTPYDGAESAEIALSYMGVDQFNNERFAFLRAYAPYGSPGYGWAVTALSIQNTGGVLSFPNTADPFLLVNPFTDLGSSALGAAGFGSTDLTSVIGGGVVAGTVGCYGNLRNIVAKRYDPQGRVVVFLYGAPMVGGALEGDDIRSVTFTPASSGVVTLPANSAAYVNDFTEAMANHYGFTLMDRCSTAASSRVDGKVTNWWNANLQWMSTLSNYQARALRQTS